MANRFRIRKEGNIYLVLDRKTGEILELNETGFLIFKLYVIDRKDIVTIIKIISEKYDVTEISENELRTMIEEFLSKINEILKRKNF